MKKKSKKYILAISAAVAVQVSGWVVADVQDFGNTIPDEKDIIKALKFKTRGLRPVKSTPKLSEEVRTEIAATTEETDKPDGASFGALTFAFNSAELTATAKTLLDKIGAALQNDALSTFTFRIEGHTDSSGRESYNDWLSSERAAAARNYLVRSFTIDARRLEIIGKGETDPLNKDNPGAAENRRVQIVNLGRK